MIESGDNDENAQLKSGSEALVIPYLKAFSYEVQFFWWKRKNQLKELMTINESILKIYQDENIFKRRFFYFSSDREHCF